MKNVISFIMMVDYRGHVHHCSTALPIEAAEFWAQRAAERNPNHNYFFGYFVED